MTEGLWNYIEWIDKQQIKLEISDEKALSQWVKEHDNIQKALNLEAEDNMIDDVKDSLYEWLLLDEVLENNSDVEKFVKGIVDGLVLENIELVKGLIESGIDELLEILKSILDPEVIWEIIKSIWEDLWDIMDIFNKPYDWWVAIWWLGLWILGKWMKWVRIAWKIKDWHEIKDLEWNKDLHDTLDWNFSFNKMDSWFKEVANDVEKLAWAIDIKYLSVKPERIRGLAKNILNISKYIDVNKSEIISSKNFVDFKYALSDIRKQLEVIVKSSDFSERDIF